MKGAFSVNDLKNGILDINGFLLGPNTTVEQLENYFSLKATHGQYRSHFDFGGKSFVNNGVEFKAEISLKQHVVEINLFPQLPELVERYGTPNNWKYPHVGSPEQDLAYFRDIRAVMDEWLEKQLGTPTYKDHDVTEYKMGNILLGTDSYLDSRSRDMRVVGGSVDIYYR